MVGFNFNVYGHDFERGLMILRDSLTAALTALDDQRTKIHVEYDAYNLGLARGDEPTGEFNHQTGSWVWEQSQFFDYELELIDETKAAIRKAHTVAVYHHWERVIRSWTGLHGNESHDELAAAATAKGVAVPDRLKTVSHLNNVLKHSSRRSGPNLLAEWPEVFREGQAEIITNELKAAAERKERGEDADYSPDWFEAIHLSDKHIDEVFAVTRAGGPRAHIPAA